MLKALELASQVIMYLATQTVLYSNNTDVFVEEAPLLEHSPCVSWSRWYNLLVWDEECPTLWDFAIRWFCMCL